MLYSKLSEIRGVGKVRKQALLKELGSIENIKQATTEELQRIPGITQKLAQVIHSSLV